MDSFVRHTGLVAPLDLEKVDTDQILPKQFMKISNKSGFAKACFHDWRFNPDGSLIPDFVLNRKRYKEASILVTGRNFGMGSSREHAVWALYQYGFRSIIAPSFHDIFRINCSQNGLLLVTLPNEKIRRLMRLADAHKNFRLTVDLEEKVLTNEEHDIAWNFDVDASLRYRFLKGLDEISHTLLHEEMIREYERSRPSFMPTVSRHASSI